MAGKQDFIAFVYAFFCCYLTSFTDRSRLWKQDPAGGRFFLFDRSAIVHRDIFPALNFGVWYIFSFLFAFVYVYSGSETECKGRGSRSLIYSRFVDPVQLSVLNLCGLLLKLFIGLWQPDLYRFIHALDVYMYGYIILWGSREPLSQ